VKSTEKLHATFNTHVSCLFYEIHSLSLRGRGKRFHILWEMEEYVRGATQNQMTGPIRLVCRQLDSPELKQHATAKSIVDNIQF
jgi:hypothetical protein